MDNLSSCYFCGTALDDPLREYPVVPEGLRTADDVATATLCPACHRKLETVLDEVVAAVEAGGEATLDPDAVTQSSAADETTDTVMASEGTGDAVNATGDDIGNPETVTDDGDDSLLSPDDEQADSEDGTDSEEVTAEDVDALAGDIDSGILDDDDETDGSEDDADDDIESAMEPDVPDEFDTEGAATSEKSRTAESDDEPEDSGDAAEELSFDADPGEGGADEGDAGLDEGTGADDTASGAVEKSAETADGDDSGAGGDGEEAARASISALEYNKVMRLLQNREFPVGREEIETVAANAYGLSQSECAEVIDLAVERGLIDEDGEELVRPE